MNQVEAAEKAKSAGGRARESLFSRRYVIPFVLACVILACNQATGSTRSSATTQHPPAGGALGRAGALGLRDLTLVNFLLTIVGVLLVDAAPQVPPVGRDGRIIASLVAVGLIFRSTEKLRVDCRDALQPPCFPTRRSGWRSTGPRPRASRSVGRGREGDLGRTGLPRRDLFYGGLPRGDERRALRRRHRRAGRHREGRCVPPNGVVAFFSNPFADLGRREPRPS